MQSNHVMLLLSLIIPHVIFVEYDMCSLLLSPHTSGWEMNRIGKRIIVMSIRLVVNQSAYL
jgi:hypothetical protein